VAKGLLIEAAQDSAVARGRSRPIVDNATAEAESYLDDFSCDLDDDVLIAPEAPPVPVEEEVDKDRAWETRLRFDVQQEVHAYLSATEAIAGTRVDTLEWWRSNRSMYPHTAVLARKWLCVIATSTPSERVFSACGAMDRPRRSRMEGKALESQVFLNNNYDVASNAASYAASGRDRENG
jgi:hypothetical protein